MAQQMEAKMAPDAPDRSMPVPVTTLDARFEDGGPSGSPTLTITADGGPTLLVHTGTTATPGGAPSPADLMAIDDLHRTISAFRNAVHSASAQRGAPQRRQGQVI